MTGNSTPMGGGLPGSASKDEFTPFEFPIQQGGGFLNSTEGFSTLSLVAGITTRDALKTFFDRHQSEIIRAKGLLKMEGGNKVLQFSSSGLEMEDFNKPLVRSELVLIAKDEDMESIKGSLPLGFAACGR